MHVLLPPYRPQEYHAGGLQLTTTSGMHALPGPAVPPCVQPHAPGYGRSTPCVREARQHACRCTITDRIPRTRDDLSCGRRWRSRTAAAARTRTASSCSQCSPAPTSPSRRGRRSPGSPLRPATAPPPPSVSKYSPSTYVTDTPSPPHTLPETIPCVPLIALLSRHHHVTSKHSLGL